MDKKERRLSINRETLRRLDNDELVQVAGGQQQLSNLLPTCYCVPFTYGCNTNYCIAIGD